MPYYSGVSAAAFAEPVRAVSEGSPRRNLPRRLTVRLATIAGAIGLLCAPTGAQVPPAVPPPALSQAAPGAPPPFSMIVNWTATLPAAPAFAPIADARRLFVAIRSGSLTALDIATGATGWSASVASIAQPAVAGGLVVAASAEGLVAFDSSSGKPGWSRPLDRRVVAPLSASDRQVVACLEDGTVVSIASADGTEMWRRQIGSEPAVRSVLDGTTVYILRADGAIDCVAAATGRPVWSAKIGPGPSGLLHDRDWVYAGARDNYLYCLDARTGHIRWRWRSGADIVGTPATDGRRVFYAALDNQLYALDRGNGSQRWKRPLPTRPGSGPLPFDDLLLVSGISPAIRAYRANNGAPAGQVAALDELAGAPLVVRPGGDILGLLVVTGGGQVQLFVPGLPVAPTAPPK